MIIILLIILLVCCYLLVVVSLLSSYWLYHIAVYRPSGTPKAFLAEAAEAREGPLEITKGITNIHQPLLYPLVNDGGWVDPKNGDAAKNWWLPSGKLT